VTKKVNLCFQKVDQNQNKEAQDNRSNNSIEEHLNKVGMNKAADFLHQGVELLSQLVMEVEIAHQEGMKKYE
jgi:hypothetical protein